MSNQYNYDIHGADNSQGSHKKKNQYQSQAKPNDFLKQLNKEMEYLMEDEFDSNDPFVENHHDPLDPTLPNANPFLYSSVETPTQRLKREENEERNSLLRNNKFGEIDKRGL